jgi:hypothetical protein
VGFGPPQSSNKGPSGPFFVKGVLLDRDVNLSQHHWAAARQARLLEEVVDLARVHEAVATGDDEGDPPPAMADDGGQLVFERPELQLVIPLAGAGVVRLGGDQVAASCQLLALDGGVVAKWPKRNEQGRKLRP